MARLEIGQIIAVIKEKLPEAVVEEVVTPTEAVGGDSSSGGEIDGVAGQAPVAPIRGAVDDDAVGFEPVAGVLPGRGPLLAHDQQGGVAEKQNPYSSEGPGIGICHLLTSAHPIKYLPTLNFSSNIFRRARYLPTLNS